MTIVQMRYFKSVCSTLSFSKTAELSFVSQPAISSAIKDLEEEFGLKLFKRSNNKLTITEAGKVFLERCNYILDYIDETKSMMKDLGDNYNLIKIGVPPMIGTFIFPVIFKKYKQLYPYVNVELFEAGSVLVREAVENNVIDVGIAVLNELPLDKINYIKTTETELVFFVSKKHRLAKKKHISIQDLDNEKIILLKNDSFQNSLIKERFKNNNVNLNVILSTSQINMIVEMLSYDNVGAFLFKEIGAFYKDIVAIPLDIPIKIDIGLIWNKSNQLFSDTKNFIQFVWEIKHKT